MENIIYIIIKYKDIWDCSLGEESWGTNTPPTEQNIANLPCTFV